MNVYDQAHSLAKAIKECEEYKQYMNIKKTVEQNPQLDQMIKDFQQKQFEVQAMQMAGQEADPELMNKIQELVGIVMADPLAAQYMQCEMRFALMMQDVLQIVNEPIAGPSPKEGN